MTDLLATIPPTERQSSYETIPWSVNIAPLLSQSEIASSPTITLLDLATNLSYLSGLIGGPDLVGNIITQVVTNLLKGHTYRLVYTFIAAPGKVLSTSVVIECPF